MVAWCRDEKWKVKTPRASSARSSVVVGWVGGLVGWFASMMGDRLAMEEVGGGLRAVLALAHQQ